MNETKKEKKNTKSRNQDVARLGHTNRKQETKQTNGAKEKLNKIETHITEKGNKTN